jgi:hypothetical protein
MRSQTTTLALWPIPLIRLYKINCYLIDFSKNKSKNLSRLGTGYKKVLKHFYNLLIFLLSFK